MTTENMMSEEARLTLTEMRREMESKNTAGSLQQREHITSHMAVTSARLSDTPTAINSDGEHSTHCNTVKPESANPYFNTLTHMNSKERGSDSTRHQANENAVMMAYTSRQFEITPIGYDSRYSQPNIFVQHTSDDEDGLISQIIEQSVEKCHHWLNNHTIQKHSKT